MHVSAPTCKTSRVAFRSAHYRIILPFLLNSKLQWFASVQYLLKPQMKYCGREGERRLYDACSLNHWCCIIEGGGVGRSEGGSWGFAGIKNPCSRGRRSQIKRSRWFVFICSRPRCSANGREDTDSKSRVVHILPSLNVYNRTWPGSLKASSPSLSSFPQDVLSRSWALQLANAKP